MKRLQTLFALLLLPLGGAALAQGSWTNQAGQVLSAVPVELKGSQVVFKKGTTCVTYPLSAFLPVEQQRLKAALGIVEVPAGLADDYALMQRVLKRLRLFHAEGRLSDEAYHDARARARESFRKKATPFVEKGILSKRDMAQMAQ